MWLVELRDHSQDSHPWHIHPWLPTTTNWRVVVVQWLSHIWLFATPWTPGSSVLHCLPEFAQIHVYWVSDTIQPSHPLPPPSPLAFNLSQHQGLFQWISSLHQEAKILELQLQHQSLQLIFRVDFLYDWLVWSCCPRDSQESSPAQFESISSSALSLLYDPTLTFEKEIATHSSILAWRIPWTEEPGGLQSIGSQRVGHNWSDLALALEKT